VFLKALTKNVLILNFKFFKVVEHLKCGWQRGMNSVAICWGIQQWKNFENRPTFVEVMNQCRVAQFFDSLTKLLISKALSYGPCVTREITQFYLPPTHEPSIPAFTLHKILITVGPRTVATD